MAETDHILFELRKSRKAFITEYACGVFLAALWLWSFTKETLPPLARPALFFAALLAFTSAEMSRQFIRYLFTPAKIIVIKGFLKQSKKNVYYHSMAFVPDINIHQTRMQRLLGYGKIHCYGGSGGMSDSFELVDIDNPKIVLDRIEELITLARIPLQQREKAKPSDKA